MLEIKEVTDVMADVVIYQPPKLADGKKALPAFVVQVPAVTRTQIDELTKACNAVNERAGFLTEAEQTERFNEENKRRAPYIFVKGWRGCTVEALAYLGIALGAPPELDQDGCIPFDGAIAQQIWAKAYPERFARKIAERSRDILEGQAIAERDRGNG